MRWGDLDLLGDLPPPPRGDLERLGDLRLGGDRLGLRDLPRGPPPPLGGLRRGGDRRRIGERFL